MDDSRHPPPATTSRDSTVLALAGFASNLIVNARDKIIKVKTGWACVIYEPILRKSGENRRKQLE